jgi:hypothetical protein
MVPGAARARSLRELRFARLDEPVTAEATAALLRANRRGNLDDER